MKLNCYDEVKALTQELVGIDSVVSMPEGESAVARYIRDYYQALSYFQAHPRQTGIFQTKNDGVERHCALTWIRGTKDGGGDETVVLIGHIDTVGVEEFGPIRDYAFRPAELPQKLKEYFSLSPQVLADLESGEYMFGRGYEIRCGGPHGDDEVFFPAPGGASGQSGPCGRMRRGG